MGPLELVVAKDRLCDALEKIWGHPGAVGRCHKALSAATGAELEAVVAGLGMELMDAGRLEAGWEFAKTWKALAASGAGPRSPEDEDEAEEAEGPAPKSAWSLGLGKAFSKHGLSHELSTSDELAGASTGDHQGAVTEWSGEEDSAVAKRGFARGKVGLPLAKAELAAVARSKLGSKATKIVARVEQALDAGQLALSVGEAQRKLVRAGLPRLAAKMAKKWLDLRGRLE
jgi:hypothetical protein